MEETERDDFFNEAAIIIVNEQIASTSLIQRRLKLGYNRAGRIMDQLIEAGIVTAGMAAVERTPKFKTISDLCTFLKIDLASVGLVIKNDCITDKCTYPNCQCPAERLSIITAGSLDRKGISNKWLDVYAEMQNWYGDIGKKESAEQLLKRLQDKHGV